jgi:hypothetical protein
MPSNSPAPFGEILASGGVELKYEIAVPEGRSVEVKIPVLSGVELKFCPARHPGSCSRCRNPASGGVELKYALLHLVHYSAKELNTPQRGVELKCEHVERVTADGGRRNPRIWRG